MIGLTITLILAILNLALGFINHYNKKHTLAEFNFFSAGFAFMSVLAQAFK